MSESSCAALKIAILTLSVFLWGVADFKQWLDTLSVFKTPSPARTT